MTDRQTSSWEDRRPAVPPDRRWALLLIGVVSFHVSLIIPGFDGTIWLPAAGIGIALTAWLGLWAAGPLAADYLLVRLLAGADPLLSITEALLLGVQMAGSWWCYHGLGKGTRRLEDPLSATLFLILVAGGMAALTGLAAAFARGLAGHVDLRQHAAHEWIVRALGVLVLVAPLLSLLTPTVVSLGLASPEPVIKQPGGMHPTDWTLGELVEVLGLTTATVVLAIVLGRTGTNLHLWGFSLLLIVWTGLRQGLRGGTLAAGASALTALTLVSYGESPPEVIASIQGLTLAQCSVALLVGASAGWIRASEARYRQVVGHIPVVLYSVRLPRRLREPKGGKLGGLGVLHAAEVTLVSPASRDVLEAEPDDLLGPYESWQERVVEADRELVIAALAQLGLQKEPVTCEYRMSGRGPAAPEPPPAVNEIGTLKPVLPRAPNERWVRETLAPQYDADGHLAGWEGVIEDITAQRTLAHDLRITTGLLQALVSNLPTGVFFIQGNGHVLLMNARAKKLLGQREHLAGGLQYLSRTYRLRRLDGSEYPWEELPVCRALREGATCMINDMVVHRPDGKRVPLVSWAAPVDLQGVGQPDAAVWVLEDLTALQQAETARRETEQRLRVVVENLAEGLIVLDQSGTVIEGNPAAATLLGVAADQLVGRVFLAPDAGCLREDGSDLLPSEHPDRRALRSGEPVRNMVMGLPLRPEPVSPRHWEEEASLSPAARRGGEETGRPVRWLLVNAMPLPLMPAAVHPGRLVVSFADVTEQRKSLEDLQRAQRLELIGRLASGTIHDFNNLLTVMTGLAALSQTQLPPDHPVSPDLARIVEAGEQASQIAGQLLAFSKQHRQAPRSVDVNVVVMHTLKLLQRVFPHNIVVQASLAPGGAMTRADETQLKQVLMNLCLNARDAMPRGGKLQVRTENVQDGPRPQAPGENHAAWVKIAVQDSGTGMDEVIKAKIFDPFFTTKERGTGLGLAVVKQIVEGHGGHIAVESRPHQGTAMHIWLPAEPTGNLP